MISPEVGGELGKWVELFQLNKTVRREEGLNSWKYGQTWLSIISLVVIVIQRDRVTDHEANSGCYKPHDKIQVRVRSNSKPDKI